MRAMTWEEELASEVETVKSDAVLTRAQALIDQSRAQEGKKRLRIDGRHVDAKVIEKSNVRSVIEMTRMIEVTRNYTQVAGILQQQSDMRRSAIEKLAEVPA